MTPIQLIPLMTISGAADTLANHTENVLLVVNVASKCGLTRQYEGLEQLYLRYRGQGFEVLGFPANNFAGQEPGSDAEIEDFCKLTFDVNFPMFSKVSVAGSDKHPLYAALTEAQPIAVVPAGGGMRERLAEHGIQPNSEPEVLWNFEKFLVGRGGDVVARFAPDTAPDDPVMVAAIERELGLTPHARHTDLSAGSAETLAVSPS